MNDEILKFNVQKVLDEYKITLSEFSRLANIGYTTLNSQMNNGKIGTQFLLAILRVYPKISAEWLMRNTGTMFIEEKEPATQAPYINAPGAHGNITNIGNGSQVVGADAKPTMTKEEAMAALIKQNQEIISLLSK